MQATNQMSLTDAVNRLNGILDEIAAGKPVRAEGLEIKPGSPVALEVEAEVGEDGGEVEFEIKWPYLPPATLADALTQIGDFAGTLGTGSVEIRGRTFAIGSKVEVDLDLEGTPHAGELEWEIEWPAPDGVALGDAANKLSEVVAEIRKAGVVTFGGKEIGMTELVTLRIESEGDASEGELEVEVNWPHIPERTLAKAVEEIRSVLSRLNSGATNIVGTDVRISGPVEVDVELSGDATEGELELKISW